MQKSITIPKVWLSEIRLLSGFIVSLILSIVLSNKYPYLVINLDFIHFPVLLLFPAFFLLRGAFKIYNVRYTIDPLGIQSRIGVLWVSQTISRVRYEDIRTLELKQTLFERFLRIGNIEIGTAATSDVEIILSGIAHIHEVFEMIAEERDRRQKIFAGNRTGAVA